MNLLHAVYPKRARISPSPGCATHNNRLWNGYNDAWALPVLLEPPANWPAGWKRDSH